MPTLTTTVSGATSNGYISTADADTYFDERLNVSAWADATTDDKERAIIMASRRLDIETYYGEKATSGQALEWPRIGAYDRDGEEYDTAAIPAFLEAATCELALRFLNDGTTDTLADTGLEEFTSSSVGPLNVERSATFKAGQLPQTVRRLIRHVLAAGGASSRLSRA